MQVTQAVEVVAGVMMRVEEKYKFYTFHRESRREHPWGDDGGRDVESLSTEPQDGSGGKGNKRPHQSCSSSHHSSKSTCILTQPTGRTNATQRAWRVREGQLRMMTQRVRGPNRVRGPQRVRGLWAVTAKVAVKVMWMIQM